MKTTKWRAVDTILAWFSARRGGTPRTFSNYSVLSLGSAGLRSRRRRLIPVVEELEHRCLLTPVVTQVTPNFGPTTGGTSVSVSGSGFTQVMSVVFGSGHQGMNLHVNSSTSLTVTSPPESAGVVDIIVNTMSGSSATSSADKFSFASGSVNLTNPGNQTNTVGDAVSLQLNATASPTSPITYAASNLPPGLSLNTSTGAITGSISNTANTGTPYSVAVTAYANGANATQNFTWTVNGVTVTLNNPGNQSNYDGDSVSLQLSASSSPSRPITYSASGLPFGLGVNTGGLICGTIMPNADANSPYTVTVTATSVETVASKTFTWTVTGLAISLGNPGNQTNSNGDTIDVQLSATCNPSRPVVYSATGLPPGVGIDPNSGLISGIISSTAQVFQVTATATVSGVFTSQSFTWTINSTSVNLSNPGTQTNTDGDPVNLQLTAAATPSSPITYDATGLPNGLVVDPSSGLISGTISSTADTDSPYQVTVSATAAGVTATQSFTWTVGALVVTLINPGAQGSYDGDTISLQLNAAASPSRAITYTETGLPAGLRLNASTGLISGTITDTADVQSPYSVALTATAAGVSAAQTLTWTVGSTTLTLTNPGEQVDYDSDPVSLQLNATSTAGRPISYSATGLPPGLSVGSATGLISGSLTSTADGEGPYYVTVAATAAGVTASQTFTWLVEPIVLTLDNPSDQYNADGDLVSLQLSATCEPGRPTNYVASSLPPGLAVNASTGLISGTISLGADTQSPYTVQVSASAAGITINQTFSWNVAVPALTLANPGSLTDTVGDTVDVPMSASDSASHVVTYAATGLPPGLSISSATGVISGTVAAGAGSGSPYSVTVTAADDPDSAVTASETFNGR